ncbi:MAG: AgmX/PglI C-terminal domain-containing protein [Archangium sp.]|nr:AgmX/PglI C-terminal domain-containing protein [Archangium sp.]
MLSAGQSLNLASNGDQLPRADAPIRFDVSAGGRFEVGFVEGVVGEVMRNGETPLSLGDVVHRGLAVESDGGWACELGRSDTVRLGRGPIWLEAERVAAPKQTRGGFALDYGFLNTLLVCFAGFALMAMSAEFNVDADDPDDSTSMDTTRMSHILVKAAQPLPQKVQPTTPEKLATKDPEKVKPAPGKPAPPNKPIRDTGGNQNQDSAKTIAGKIFGGKGATGIFGEGGIGKELKGALGNVVATAGDGRGGWDIKGNGAGGPEGDPERIGAIPTSGIAAKKGIGALCKGPGPCKKSDIPPPSWEDEVSICKAEGGGQCMDKELIRKVIAGHRDQIRFCYEQALQTAPSLAGKVGVSWVVSSAGSVPTARVETSTVRSEAVGDCLVSRIRTWQFPVGKGAGGYRVTYPFVFKPSGG